MAEPKIAEEVAQADFLRMCETFRVDLDETSMTDAEKADLKSLRAEVVKDIRAGRLVISAEGFPTYNPVGQKPLVFKKPTGATMMALETHPGEKNISNTMAALTDMTESSAGLFSKMEARDVQRLMRLGKLFLADQ